MLGFYNKYVLPRLLDRGMRSAAFNGTRSRAVSAAQGTVLEIGFGSGYNLPFYTGVTMLYALDPSRTLYTYAADRIAAVSFPVSYLESSAEQIPSPDNSVDTVVSTWSLCSIPNVLNALLEVRRVLKPGGQFLFVEHGKSPRKIISSIQALLTPVNKICAGNCHLDRKIDDYIIASGLVIKNLETFPEEGRPLMYSYRGVAVKE